MISVDSQKLLPVKKNQKFELKPEDKLQVDFRHLAYYTLLWIAYVDNHYNLHYILKAKISRYPKRME